MAGGWEELVRFFLCRRKKKDKEGEESRGRGKKGIMVLSNSIYCL